MKQVIIYKGLVIAVLLLVASVARAEIVGIKDGGECPKTYIKQPQDLQAVFATLSTSKPSDFYNYDSNHNQFVVCWNTSVSLGTAVTLNYNGAVPVIIYGLKVNPPVEATDPNGKLGVNLLTTTGPILLQNLTATNLRGPIVLNGAASMKDSALSCDTSDTRYAYVNGAILEVKGSGGKVSGTSISNCPSGISVTGLGNTLTDVAVVFDKVAAASVDDGITGVTLGTGNILTASALGKTTISGFATAIEMQSSTQASKVQVSGPVMMNESSKLSGSTINGTIHVSGGNVLISKSTLAGDPAVAITKGLTGVTVTQNLYLFKAKTHIAYVDPDDSKERTVFDVAWFAANLSKIDSIEYVTRLFGKLMDQNSPATNVEVYLHDMANDDDKYPFLLFCPVGIASDEMCFSGGGDAGKKCIHKGEKVFDCSKESIGKDFQVPPKSFVRLLSNTPTVSVMSEQVDLKSISEYTIIAIAQPTVPIGSELQGVPVNDTMGDGGTFVAQKLPDPTDVGDNSHTDSSTQGNNATGDAMTLGGEVPVGIVGGADGAGATGLAGSLTSGKGCSLVPVGIDHHQTANALVWLIALLPLPLLIPYRRSKNRK